MKVNREGLLKSLLTLTPGLASRELIEQSSCIVLTEDGRAMSFNDEICASRESPLKGIVGAIKAKPLLDLLSKLTEEDLEIEQGQGELIVKGKGKGRKSGIRMEANVLLPVTEVDVPEDWRKLSPHFSEAVGIVHSCAATEQSEFAYVCVHIHPDHLEATDKFQIARYPLKTGVDRSMLVRAESLKKILGYEMSQISETKSWVHFKNATGLTISIRRDLSDYPVLDKYLTSAGTSPVTLPGGLEEVVSKAEIFSSESTTGNLVSIDIKAGWLLIEGKGPAGWYKERVEVVYDGPSMKFDIAPKLLLEITKRANDCGVSERRLFVQGSNFVYATSTKVRPVVAAPKEE